jgi:hypothetical protein
MSGLSPGPQLAMVGDTGAQGCNGISFPSLNNNNKHIFYSCSKRQNKKTEERWGGPALEANASCRCFKLRLTASRTSRAIFRSWGIS